MATSYSDIYDTFLYKIEGYKLMMLLTEDREQIMNKYLNAACRKAYKRCKRYVDLMDKDDEAQEFNIDLEEDMIDILADYMVSEWLKPKLYSEELLESRLNTRDFTEFSPAKMIEQIRYTVGECELAAKVAVNNYTFSHGDIAELNAP